jgi:DNA-directed RNA polymerase alpha subunit
MFRAQKAACLRDDGLTYVAIGEILGVSAGRASELARIGRKQHEPDEMIFPVALERSTPTRLLPVSKVTRHALKDAGIHTFGAYLEAGETLVPKLLRFPNFGRRRLEELEALKPAMLAG